MFFDKWLNIESKFQFKHFVCDWTSDVPKTRWVELPPEKFTFEKKIYLKSYCTFIYVYGIFNKKETPFVYRNEISYDNVPFIKSLLQKTVRRQNKLCAVKAMKILIKLNITLAIIMIEDVEVLESLPTIVWMTTVISFWKPPRRCVEWLLGVVHSLCIHPIYFNFCEYEKERKILDNISSLSNKRKQIIYSLQIRISYGGLPCDMRMIDRASVYFKNNDPKKTKSYLIDWDSIELLSIEEWELSSVDFHVTPIARFIEKESSFSEEYIRKLIWEYKSSINKREKQLRYNSKTREEDFKTFERRLGQIAYGILARKFKDNIEQEKKKLNLLF
jgi:hypothetical protein